jgi:hypothetical protein
LARRFAAGSNGIIETYPFEGYPVDNAPGLASLILHQRTTGTDHAAVVQATLARYRREWRDERSGLLWQAIDGNDRPTDG